MTFKKYYQEDICIRRFYFISSIFKNQVYYAIDNNNNKQEIKNIKLKDEFVNYVFQEIENIKELYIYNDDGKISISFDDLDNVRIVGNSLFIDIVNGLLDIWEGIDDFSLEKSMGIVFEDGTIPIEYEANILFTSINKIYTLELYPEDAKIDGLLMILQSHTYNFCLNQKYDLNTLFQYVGYFCENFKDDINLYVDTINISETTFAFINNSQNIFLMALVTSFLINNNLTNDS